MNAIREEQLLRAIKATADLVGYTIKKVSTGDDLKMRTMTIAFETASSGHVQETLDFERENTKYNVNGRGEVVDLEPGDLTETPFGSGPNVETDPDDQPALEPIEEPAEAPVEASRRR